MARFVPSSLLSLALCASVLTSAPSFAQSRSPASSPSTAPQPTSPILAPKSEPAREAAPRRRAISGDVAAALAAAAPKYTPPAPQPEPIPESERPDMREIDKPKNTIVRLPEYIVQERKPPVLTERAVSTEQGLTDIAVRRYISDVDRALNRFTLPLFGASYQQRALAMYAEDERLRNMSDLKGAAEGASQSDAAAGAYIRREAQQTFIRNSDFGWQSGGTQHNGGPR
jgi:hypothetical protein